MSNNINMPDELVADVTAIFVQPHFDDVALSMGGITALHTAAGQVGLNVTLFGAVPAPDLQVSEFVRVVEGAYTTDDFSREALWQLRRREDDEAADILAVRSLRLPYMDLIYRSPNYDSIAAIMTDEVHPRGRARIQPCDEPLIDQIGSDLLAIWQRTRQATVYLPMAVGGHIDHVICHQAGVRSLIRAGASVWFYEDFPYAFWWRDAVEKRQRTLGPLEKQEVDITSVLPVRLRAIAAYRSQLDALFSKWGGFEHAVKQYSSVVEAADPRFVERLWRFR